MKKYIVLFTLIIVLLLIGVIIIMYIFIKPNHNIINGRIKTYYVNDSIKEIYLSEYDSFMVENNHNIHMPENEVNILFNKPEDYSFFSLDIYITNISSENVYITKASEDAKYSGIWFNNSSFCEYGMCLIPGESYNGIINFIVKSSDYRNEDINNIVKNLKLNIRYTTCKNYNVLPQYNDIITYSKD